MLHSMEPNSTSPAAPEATERRGDRAFPWVLLIVAAIAGALLATFRPDRTGDAPVQPQAPATQNAQPWTPAPRPEGETVSLTIDFGNGASRRWEALPFVPGMTLAGLMEEARRFQPSLVFTQRGEGKLAFLTSLEGVANEGGAGRYWIYSINGDDGQVSFAVQELEPGDAVLWEFRRQE
jgi:hypothetical protein